MNNLILHFLCFNVVMVPDLLLVIVFILLKSTLSIVIFLAE